MSAAMHICVIKPTMFGKQAKDALPPLLFALLAPLTPPGVRLSFYDENIGPIPPDTCCDAVAISLDSFTARRAYTLAAGFKARGIPVILGGFHPTLCPDEAAQHADAVVIGEAEDTWGAVVDDLLSGTLKPRYVSSNSSHLAGVAFDYSVFAGKKYPSVCMVQFVRGCRFNCDFCSIHAFYRGGVRAFPAATVAKAFKESPAKLFFFTDDNLFSNPAGLEELLVLIAPLKRRWVCQISMDAASDLALLQRLKSSGCVMVLMGFESLEEDNLRQMNKRANLGEAEGLEPAPAQPAASLAATYHTAIANVRQAGLMLYGTFVIGYDADTPQTAQQLAAFARKNGFAIANFNPLIPTPGTALYARLERQGRLLYERWWDSPNYRYGDTAFMPAGMSPQQLAESCRQARYSFYSLRGILRRLRGINAKGLFNLWAYLLLNLVSRASIHQKQGRRLG